MVINDKTRSEWIANRIKELKDSGSPKGAATDTAIHEWVDIELHSAAESGL